MLFACEWAPGLLTSGRRPQVLTVDGLWSVAGGGLSAQGGAGHTSRDRPSGERGLASPAPLTPHGPSALTCRDPRGHADVRAPGVSRFSAFLRHRLPRWPTCPEDRVSSSAGVTTGPAPTEAAPAGLSFPLGCRRGCGRHALLRRHRLRSAFDLPDAHHGEPAQRERGQEHDRDAESTEEADVLEELPRRAADRLTDRRALPDRRERNAENEPRSA